MGSLPWVAERAGPALARREGGGGGGEPAVQGSRGARPPTPGQARVAGEVGQRRVGELRLHHLTDGDRRPSGRLDADRVPGADVTFFDDAEVDAWALGIAEPLRERVVAHADAELVARFSWLRDFEHARPDVPAVADGTGVQGHPGRRQVLTERARPQRPRRRSGPGVVFWRVRVDGFDVVAVQSKV